MIWNIAWKNVWRNKLRSSVVIFAVMIGLLAGAFAIALIEGFSVQRTRALINNETSHIQIHNPEFTHNNEAKYVIEEAREIKDFLADEPSLIGLTSRLKFNVMANSAYTSAGVQMLAINPEDEKNVTEIYKYVNTHTGNYFERNKKNQILVGQALIKKLKLDKYMITDSVLSMLKLKQVDPEVIEKLSKVKDQEFRNYKTYVKYLKDLLGKDIYEQNEFFLLNYPLVARMRAKINVNMLDKENNPISPTFRITGVFRTKNSQFDETTVFVAHKDIKRLTGYDSSKPHQIAILLNNKEAALPIANKLRAKFPDLKIQTWAELNPELKMLSEYMLIYNVFLIVLILAALAFGIVNTMLMAIMERTKELGMLASIGMNAKRIFNMIMLETIFLTLIGAFIGLAVNSVLLAQVSKTGIDFSKEIGAGFEAIGYDPHIYPQMGNEYYVVITVLVILTAILASIYPAIKAIKLNPSEALRSDA